MISTQDYLIQKMSCLPKVESWWIGETYSQGWDGVRLLVLGESSYGKAATAPRDLVNCHIRGEAKHWGRTYTRFLKLLDNQNRRPLDEALRRQCWSRLAFYNYLEETAGIGPRLPPPQESWLKSMPAFSAAVANLSPAPDGIIVWGYRLWAALAETCKCLKIDGAKTGYFEISPGQRISAFALKHPSAPSVRFNEWAPKLSKFVSDLRTHRTFGAL